MKPIAFLLLFLCFFLNESQADSSHLLREKRRVSYKNISVDVIIEKPEITEADVLIVYHGTVLYDKNNITATNIILENFKSILNRKDMLLISVAYPGDNRLLGDNIAEAEAALLWVKYRAEKELGIKVKKIFLAGHSQGGYLVTRLNTMHQTNGVIANAPGPLNLVYRCKLEENGKIPSESYCTDLRNTYGTTANNPKAYMQRSLLSFTKGFKSDILFVQGLDDSPIQLASWNKFKQEVKDCTDCQNTEFLEVPGGKHNSLFSDSLAKTAFNNFINSR